MVGGERENEQEKSSYALYGRHRSSLFIDRIKSLSVAAARTVSIKDEGLLIKKSLIDDLVRYISEEE